MTTRHDLIREIEAHLRSKCGYSDQLLRTNYPYEDGARSHTVPLVAFARPVYDSRTSCISVIVSDNLHGMADADVSQFRGLGTPVVLACCPNTFQWWTIGTEGAELREEHSERELDGFFDAHGAAFAPDKIWRAKNLGNVIKAEQLHFVDAGLMPLIEQEMGERLASLMERVLSLLRSAFTERQLESDLNQRWVFRAAFWLLCAKILRDKRVRNFITLNLTDIDAVLEAVASHYSAEEPVRIDNEKQRHAVGRGAAEINKFASLSNLTTEAFAYMYENVLVNRELRKALGIHATPPYLVDYIVWQLWPWIENIPEDKRVVLEPASGHAPFLTGAMRMLRFLYSGPEDDFHKYAKRRLAGIETDSFAREIARLSLTIADIPHSNGWRIADGDIYGSDVLCDKAKDAAILLCNPPFEDFTPAEQQDYAAKGQHLRSFNKAAELLWRTLPHMAEGAVFGVILPLGFLQRENLADLRRMVLDEWELSQILTLPDNVFRFAEHKSVLIFGRKKNVRDAETTEILYRHVTRSDLEDFKERYEARDQLIPQAKFRKAPGSDLRARELEDVWDYCETRLPRLGSVGEGGQGLIYKGKDLPSGSLTYGKAKFPGGVRGYALFDADVPLHGLPQEYWMNLNPDVIRRSMWGTKIGTPQILMNYARIGRGPWRIKALVDPKGHPVSGRFLVFRILNDEWTLHALWAVLNSPLANAYMFCNTMERDNPSGIFRDIPIPLCTRRTLERLNAMSREYFALMDKLESSLQLDSGYTEAARLLTAIDAEVMRLYGLPPEMERRVLDLFQGVQRKGVDFPFKGYYPKDFDLPISLYEYLSGQYSGSRVAFPDKWVTRQQASLKGLGRQVDRVTLRGFKSIKTLEGFPLRGLNILIGANGAGKTNFVDFFRLLRAMADETLQRFVAEHGGADSLLFMGPKHTRSISACLEFGPFIYEFNLIPTGSAELVFGEQHVHHAGGEKAGGATYSGSKGARESILKELHEKKSAKAWWFDALGMSIYESIASWVVYHFHDTSMHAPMRRVCSVRDNEYLRAEGENLAAFLLMLREQHQKIYGRIRDIVQLAAPFLDDFKFRPRPSNVDTVLQLEWTQKGSDYPFLVTQLSDGTLRFIALTTALLQPNPPSTILLDEPELGLHPYALNLLAALLKEAAANTQVIVSTQSALLLDNFEAEDVVVVEREDGWSTFKRQSSGELEEWLKNYSLGELWEKNVIGGRPSDG